MRFLLAASAGLAIAWSVSFSIHAQATVTVSGRVLDPYGVPSAETRILLCSVAGSDCERTQTDADGRFQFEASPDSYQIIVYNPLGGSPAFYLEGGEGNLSWDQDDFTAIEVDSSDVTGIEIALPAPTEVSGDVRRSNGTLLADVNIFLCSLANRGCYLDVTDDNGRFSLAVPRDDYWMLINASDAGAAGVYQPDAPGAFSEDQGNQGTLVVRAVPVTDIVITLPARLDAFPHILRGAITLHDGRPAQGVRVQVCGKECQRALHYEDGSFTAPAAPGATTIDILHSKEIVGRYHVGSAGNFSEDLQRFTTLDVPEDEITGIEIRLPQLTVSGRLTYPDQTPVLDANVVVCSLQDGSSCAVGQTGADGRFSLSQDWGLHTIQIEVADEIVGYYHATRSTHFTDDQASRGQVNLGLSSDELLITLPFPGDPLDFSGRAFRWDGLPDVGLSVTACHSGPRGCPHVTLTDDDGRFRFTGLPRDSYQILFTGSHRSGLYADDATGNYTEDWRRATRLDLTQESVSGLSISRFKTDDDRPHVISGTLLFANDQPAHSWDVWACNPACSTGTKLSDGRFAIQVAAGDYELQVWRDNALVGGYHQGTTWNYTERDGVYTTVTAPSEAARDIQIRLPSRTPLQIELRPGTGASFEVQSISICPVDFNHSCEFRYFPGKTFNGLVIPGKHYIQIRFATGASGFYSRENPGAFTWTQAERTGFRVRVDSPDSVTITVPARETLGINVYEPNGEAIPDSNFWVTVCSEQPSRDCAVLQNDGDGEFVLQRPRDPHYIEIRRSGYAIGSGNLTWYVNEQEPGGLVERRADATIFASDHAHPVTRVVRLPDIARTIPVEIELQPGVNLIGGPAGAIAVRELFAQAEQLVGVILLPHQGNQREVISRSQAMHSETERFLTAGRLAWLYVSGDQPISIGWNAATDSRWSHAIYEPPGWVVWRSRIPGSVSDVARGLTHLTRGPWLIGVEDGKVAARTSGTVQQGDVIWVESQIPFQPSTRDDIPPNFFYVGRDDTGFRTETERMFNDVIDFFWTEFGLEADALDVEIYDDIETPEYLLARCGWAREDVEIACVDARTMAREYTRALQYRIGRELATPGWLIEGAVEYAAGLYLQHANQTDDDPIAEHRSPQARAIASASETTLKRLEPAANLWRPVEIPMSTTLSALAVDWLVNHAGGYDAVWTYFRHGFANLIDDSRMIHDWNAGFEAAFGLTIDEFYEQFAEYRSNGFNPDHE